MHEEGQKTESTRRPDGGDDRNRTGVFGFAIRCVTTPPRRPDNRHSKLQVRYPRFKRTCFLDFDSRAYRHFLSG